MVNVASCRMYHLESILHIELALADTLSVYNDMSIGFLTERQYHEDIPL